MAENITPSSTTLSTNWGTGSSIEDMSGWGRKDDLTIATIQVEWTPFYLLSHHSGLPVTWHCHPQQPARIRATSFYSDTKKRTWKGFIYPNIVIDFICCPYILGWSQWTNKLGNKINRIEGPTVKLVKSQVKQVSSVSQPFFGLRG